MTITTTKFDENEFEISNGTYAVRVHRSCGDTLWYAVPHWDRTACPSFFTLIKAKNEALDMIHKKVAETIKEEAIKAGVDLATKSIAAKHAGTLRTLLIYHAGQSVLYAVKGDAKLEVYHELLAKQIIQIQKDLRIRI